MVTQVEVTEHANKQLRRLPAHVVRKLLLWILTVEQDGLEVARMAPGYHDESLRGKRKGQRSIRLSRAYRAFYVIRTDGSVEVAVVQEVNKHDY